MGWAQVQGWWRLMRTRRAHVLCRGSSVGWLGLARRIADDMEAEVAPRVEGELVENLANQSAEAATLGRMARDADESVFAGA